MPITCAGTLVMPGDVIVGDAEGVIVLPAALAEEIALDALEQEEREEWALERVRPVIHPRRLPHHRRAPRGV